MKVPSWLSVSRETAEKLEILVYMLETWNRRINLVSPASIPDAWERHLLDSAQFWTLPGPDTSKIRRWADLGSGAGFPGLVVALLAAETAPQCAVTLVESDARKAAFLTAVSAKTEIHPEIRIERIESTAPLKADIVSARALAPLDRLLPLADRHLCEGGRMLFAKGGNYPEELTVAREQWHIDVVAHPSRTQSDSAILEISKVRRRA